MGPPYGYIYTTSTKSPPYGDIYTTYTMGPAFSSYSRLCSHKFKTMLYT